MDSERLFLAGLIVPLLAVNFCGLSSKELSTQTSGLEPRFASMSNHFGQRARVASISVDETCDTFELQG